MEQSKKGIYQGIFFDYLGTLINAIMSFVMLRFYLEYVTKEDYGIWLTIFGVASVIGVVDIGIDQFYLTIIPNDKKFFNNSFSRELTRFIVLKFFIIIIFFVFGLIIYYNLENIIDIPIKKLIISKQLFIATIFLLLFNIFSSTLTTILYGRSHFSFINIIVNICLFFSNVIALILLYWSYGLVSFPLSQLVMSIAQFIIFFLFVKKKYPHLKFGKLSLLGQFEMLRYSFSFQVLKWAFIIRTQSLILIINNLIGPGGVSTYNITNRLPQMVPTYLNKIVTPMFPSFSKLYFSNDVINMREMSIKLFKVLSRFGIFLSFGIIFFNKSFVTLWINSEFFVGDSFNLVLSIYILLISISSCFGIIIYSTKNFGKWPLLSVLEIFLTIFLSIFLGQKFGFIGILIGFLIGSMITQFYLIFISLKQIDLSLTRLICESYFYILLPNAFSIFIGFIIVSTIEVNSWSKLVLALFIYLVSHFFVLELNNFFKFDGAGFKNRVYYTFKL